LEVVDFSMSHARNLPSPYSDYFVDEQSYETDASRTRGATIRSALTLIHSPEAVRKFGRLIDETRPDVVHCHNVYHQLTPSIIGAAKRRRVPVVLTLHDYKLICPTYTRLRGSQPCSACIDGRFRNVVKYRCADGSLPKSLLLFAEARFQRILRSYDQVDLFIAPSEFMRASVTQQRLPPNRVKVIYNGIDCHGSTPYQSDRGYILYLGRLSAEKGIRTLLAAHAKLNEDHPLIVAGTGPLEKQLRSDYPKATYLGHVSGQMLQDTLGGASVIVVPSEWYENCPMSVLEAMAHAKPVVASDIGGIPELIVHQENGLLFPPGDSATLAHCLSKLLADPHLRRQYGMAGRQRAETHFSLHRHNATLLEEYLTLARPDARSVESAPGMYGQARATDE
jgi:glycosyltransferase involved in cell wall biosynthesis